MVYSNKLVAVVKVNGNIIREDKDIVHLPYGCEYSILLKNLSMQDCVVDVQVDGQDVLAGSRIVVRANQEHELIGFLSNASITNRFKFIQKTDKIVEYRGDRIDDGFINISFQFVKPNISYITWKTYIPPVQFRNYDVYGSFCCDSSIGFKGISGPTGLTGPTGPTGPIGCVGIPANLTSCSVNQISQDEGITVKGSQASGQYHTTYISNLETEKYNIILRLKGYTNTSQPVLKPVYNNTKLTCSTCGKTSKSHMKFCPNCGTSLI